MFDKISRLLSKNKTTCDTGEVKPSVLPSYREQLKQEELQYEHEKKKCYVCHYPLEIPEKVEQGFSIKCPRCNIVNVVTKSGTTNRPERLAIYRKYDGDLYNKSEKGLIKQLREQLEVEFQSIKAKKNSGEIDEKEYKHLYGQHYHHKEKMIAELEEQKRLELEPLWAEEAAIKEKLMGEK